MIKLVKPTMEYEKEIINYRNAFINSFDEMNGSSSLRKYEDISEWIDFVNDMETDKALGLGLVPAETYLCIRDTDNKMIGIVNIRKQLNEALLNSGGHIGYSVLPTERCNGYATTILDLALKRCFEIDINKVLVACRENNIASERVILKNNCIYENTINGIKRFWRCNCEQGTDY